MSHAKETPRQKMIGLMYLVLTCLLALNVSKEVLQGFVTINESIETTNSNFTGNTQAIMSAIDEAIGQGRHEFAPYYAKAKDVTAMTQQVYAYVDSMKKEVIKYTEDKEGADTLQLKHVESLDNYDKPTYFVLGSDETKPSTGKYSASDLRARIVTLTDSLNAMLDYMKDKEGMKIPKKDYEILKEKIKIFTPHDKYFDDEGKPLSWEIKNFFHLPLAAVVTNLSKIQGDLRNIEGEMINVFASAPGKLTVPINLYQARVVAPSQYVQTGTPYTADVFLSASSTHFKEDNVQFILGEVDTVTGALAPGAVLLPVEHGNGKITIPTPAAGNKEIRGWIKFRNGLGRYEYYRFQEDYVVANAGVAISPDKMNVLYAGVDNPVSVSAAGVAPHDLVVKIEGCEGSLEGSGNGKYTARVKGTGSSTVTVYRRTATGMERQGNPMKFFVKRIPDPVLKINTRVVPANSDFTVDEAKTIYSINLDKRDFDFDVNFRVKEFSMLVYLGPGRMEPFHCTGNQTSREVRQYLSKVRRGAIIYIEDVKVDMPGGERKLPTIKLTVK